ncbi:MAG: hypothetical protein LUH16_05590 [Clostridiales bacterium]|nr:hypothetical protein [Clostridiales bacterium]
MRRMIALLLTAVLCLQLCVPAFATETAEETTDVVAADEELTSETEENTDAVTDEAEDTSADAADETEEETASASEETAASAETDVAEAASEADETETAAETEVAAASEEAEGEASEAAEEDTSDSTEEDVTLYGGFEADYNDPEFLQLLESGAFEESEDDGISTAATYSHNSQFNGYTITKGVDVSKWNGTINWSKVKASGISFVIIRCGYRGTGDGTLYKDSMFETNVKGALAAGLEVGVYVYSQAITTAEAKAEANLAIQMCAGYDVTLPLVLDYEYLTPTTGRLANASLTKTQRTNICLAFCDTVDAAGYGAMVYANRSMLEDDTYGQQIADAGYEVWLAQWRSSTTYSGTYTYWQYSDSGSVSGISQPTSGVDVDYRYELPSPTITLTYCAATGVRLAWSEVSLADSYVVYRRASGATAWTKLGTVSSDDDLTWLDKTAVEGTTYEYVVRACDGSILSPYQRTGTSVDYDPEFSLSSATQTNSGVKLTWDASTEYDSYQIYRRVGNSGSWTKVETISDTSKTSYTDTAQLTSGAVYSYTIAGISDGTEDDYDPYGLQVTWLDMPELVSAASYKTGMKVTWKAVSGADGYRVFRKESGSWKCIATITSGSTVTYYDSAASASGTTYTYTVRAYQGSAYGPYSSSGISGTRVTAPTLVSVAQSGSSMKVQWTAVSDATKYYVYRKSSGTGWTKVGTVSASATSYSDSTASSGTVYTYTVRAVVSGNTSWYDETGVSGLYLGTVKLNYASRTDAGITVSWSTVTGAAKYAVYRKVGTSGSWTKIATVTKNSYTETESLSTTEKYYYTVRAVATYNGKTVMGGYQTAGILLSNLTIPALTGVTSSTGGLTVKWEAVTGASGYYIYRKVSGGSWSKVATVSSGTSWTDSTAKAGTVYTYTVRATDGETMSWYNTSGISGVWLSAPTISSVTTASTGVRIKWSSVDGASSYRVYRKISGGSWKLLATTTKTQYDDTDTLTTGTTYLYTVRGCTTLNGSTVLGALASNSTFCYLDAPTLKSVKVATSGLTVTWDSVAGASSYYVYRKVSGGSWSKMATVSSGTTWTDTSVKSGTTYLYTVRAVNNGNMSWYNASGISGVWLSAPTISSVTTASTGVRIKWSSVDGASSYRVYRKISGGSWKLLATTTKTQYDDTDTLTTGTTYLYTVRGCTTLNGSTVLGALASNSTFCYLDAPTLKSVKVATSGLTVTWDSVAGASSYYVYRKVSGGSWSKMATVSSGTTWTDTSVKSGTTYLYTVRAVNNGNMSWYNASGISGLWIETPELTSVATVSTGVEITWSAVENATGYRVFRKTEGGSWVFLKAVTDTSYTDSGLTAYDTNYYYTVRAYVTVSGTTYYGGYDTTGILLHYLAVPQLNDADSTSSGITISWIKVSGATSYLVYRRTSDADWTQIATLDSVATDYTDTTGVSGMTYYYTVRAKSDNGLSWYNETGVSATCQ